VAVGTTHGTITHVGQQADFGTLAGLTLAAPVVGVVINNIFPILST
jgi:hypothetical protein